MRQELAGLLQSSQSAVRQKTLANRVRLLVMDIQESEKANEPILKMDRINRLYVRGGCTVDADGTRVCFFSSLVLYLLPPIPPSRSSCSFVLMPPQDNFRKNWLGLLHLATSCGDNLVDAVIKAEATCSKHGSTLRRTNFQGAEGLIPPDCETLLLR